MKFAQQTKTKELSISTEPTRIAVLISGSGSNLQALIDATVDGFIPASIELVISNKPGVKGLERAAAAGISTGVICHQDYSSRESFDETLVQYLSDCRPDLIILAGFMRILTPVFITAFHGRLLNIHPSLLPKYPGLHTHRRALEAGDSEAGATVHFVTDELDGGPPIVQARVPIMAEDDEQSLAQRVLQVEHKIYPLAARWFCEGRLRLGKEGAALDDAKLPAQGIDYQA